MPLYQQVRSVYLMLRNNFDERLFDLLPLLLHSAFVRMLRTRCTLPSLGFCALLPNNGYASLTLRYWLHFYESGYFYAVSYVFPAFQTFVSYFDEKVHVTFSRIEFLHEMPGSFTRTSCSN